MQKARGPIDEEDAASYTFQPMSPEIRGLLRAHWQNFRKVRRYKFAPVNDVVTLERNVKEKRTKQLYVRSKSLAEYGVSCVRVDRLVAEDMRL